MIKNHFLLAYKTPRIVLKNELLAEFFTANFELGVLYASTKEFRVIFYSSNKLMRS